MRPNAPPSLGSGVEALGLFKMVTAAPRHCPTTWSPGHMRSQSSFQSRMQCTAGSRSCHESLHSHGVIEHNVLLGELQ